MLLWLQRRYLTERFPDYDPSSDRDEEKPYDLDHIQTRASWGAYWSTQLERLPSDTDNQHFRDGRDNLGDSIGNLRWIGSSENREDGDLGLREKLRLREPGKPVEASDIASTGQAGPDWKLGAFEDASHDLWWKAGAEKDSPYWTVERIAAFQEAVEKRTVWLYKEWWREAEFDKWLPL